MSYKQNTNGLPIDFKSPEALSGLPGNSAILVGFSGGSDSTALLHMLSVYADSTGAELYAAHINHGIRGIEADRDEEFCKNLANSLGIRFFRLHADVPQMAKNLGESIESVARKVRYEYFDTLMREHNIPILATAHNADDNLETILFNIARGTGLGGICGIPDCRPCKSGIVIRPILNMEKSAIIEYCHRNSLDFVTDSTNVDTDYTRNKIRMQIIPIMKQINTGAAKNAARMSETLRADSLCLESMASWFVDELGENYSIDCEKLCGSPKAIVNRALIRLFSEFSGGRKLEQTHIKALRMLAENALPHSSVSLPGEIEGVVENGKLYFREKQAKIPASDSYEIVLKSGTNPISQTNSEIFIGTSQCSKIVYKKSILLSIESDKIVGSLVARNRHAGDKLRIGGMNKSIKKLMCDKKLPLELRSRIPIICDADGVLAVPFIGIRDGARYNTYNNASDSPKTDVRFCLY